MVCFIFREIFFSGEVVSEVFTDHCTRYTRQTKRETDRQTDGEKDRQTDAMKVRDAEK